MIKHEQGAARLYDAVVQGGGARHEAPRLRLLVTVV
jgi:hypothetical protein